MKGVLEPLVGISKETGEHKIMIPGLEYYFNKTKNVQEIPFSKLAQYGK
jgi:YHS domain-containing protein